MKKILFAVFLLPCALIAAAPQEGDSVQIEALYATSTAPDTAAYGVQNCFDGTPKYWSAMPGACPDEGIMMYFEFPVYIGSVKLEMPQGTNCEKINSVKIYPDGKDAGEYPLDDYIPVDAKIRSLFIRIADAEGSEKTLVKTASSDVNFYRTRYAQKKSAAIAEIALFDRSHNRIRVIPPRRIKGTVTPSSTLQPDDAYHAGYLFDARKDSGWVEGAKGSGKGESLTFIFEKPVTITKIKIWNGLLISDIHYTSNERVKSFSFGGDTVYTIPDSQTPQTVNLSAPASGKEFIFDIKSVYPGSKYTDTVISELSFFDGSAWFSLESSDVSSRKTALLSRAQGGILESVIDRRFEETQQRDMSTKQTSIILRSDSSFVIWMEDEDNSVSGKTVRKSRVMDGFWTVNKTEGDRAEITILGRNYNLTEQFAMYSGNKKASSVTIFSDTLTITKNGIKGKKFFGGIGF